MQTGSVTIAGQKMPIYYGMLARQQYLNAIGVSVLDLADEAKQAEFIEKISTLENSIRLAYICVKDGHRKERKDFDLTYEDFCDLLDEDEDYLNVLNEVSDYVNSNTPQQEDKLKNGKAPKQTTKVKNH